MNADCRCQLVDRLSLAQRERLSHIDFKLYFLGELRRADVAAEVGRPDTLGDGFQARLAHGAAGVFTTVHEGEHHLRDIDRDAALARLYRE